jgi:hypothetical protein
MRKLLAGAWLLVVVASSARAAEPAPSGKFVLTWRKVESSGSVRGGVTVREKGKKTAVDGGVLDVTLAARGSALTGCSLRDRARPQTAVQATCSIKGRDLVIALGEGGPSGVRFQLKPQPGNRYAGEALMSHPLLPTSVVFGSAELVAAAR